jgi:uncharacterized membrane protein
MRLSGSGFVKVTLFTLFFLFFLLMAAAPLSLPPYTLYNLSGSPGIVDHTELFASLEFPRNVIYQVSDIWCHQKAERSFYLNGNQMPFCSRCTGIFLGLPIGLLISLVRKITVSDTLHRKIFGILLGGAGPLIVDGTGQWMHLWESSQISRAVTGTLAGIAGGLLLGILSDVIVAYYATREEAS